MAFKGQLTQKVASENTFCVTEAVKHCNKSIYKPPLFTYLFFQHKYWKVYINTVDIVNNGNAVAAVVFPYFKNVHNH